MNEVYADLDAQAKLTLANQAALVVLVNAQLALTRATRRAKLAEVAALERHEQQLLTILGATPQDATSAPR